MRASDRSYLKVDYCGPWDGGHESPLLEHSCAAGKMCMGTDEPDLRHAQLTVPEVRATRISLFHAPPCPTQHS
eukprot:COSAG01_NODE_10103_length_2250_cov_109.099954_2_plen_73_part_00